MDLNLVDDNNQATALPSKIKLRKKVAPENLRHPCADSPAMQATRLAVQNDFLVAADGNLVESTDLSVFNDANAQLNVAQNVVFTAETNVQSVAVGPNENCVIIDALGTVFESTAQGMPFKSLTGVLNGQRKEFGWCGVAFNRISNNVAATCMWMRRTTIVGSPATFQHEQPATSVTGSASQSGLFMIAEWNDVTIWDERSPRGGFIDRLSGTQVGGGGRGPLWSSSAVEHLFAVGGEDRTVSLFDDRRFRLVDTWRTPLKHDIVGLVLARDSKSRLRCIAQGLDHEICEHSFESSSSDQKKSNTDVVNENEELEGKTNAGRLHHNHRVFRAKSRWTGIHHRGGTVFGRDSEGILYEFSIENE